MLGDSLLERVTDQAGLNILISEQLYVMINLEMCFTSQLTLT